MVGVGGYNQYGYGQTAGGLGNGVFQGGVNITGGFDIFGQTQGGVGGVPYQQYPTSFNPAVPSNQNPAVPTTTAPPVNTIGL